MAENTGTSEVGLPAGAEARYQVLDKIGEGVYGRVYYCRDTLTQQALVLKRPQGTADLKHQLREIGTLLQLRCSSLAPGTMLTEPIIATLSCALGPLASSGGATMLPGALSLNSPGIRHPSHPNIVALVDILHDPESSDLILEKLPMTLQLLVDSFRGLPSPFDSFLPVTYVAQIVAGLASACAFMHDRRIVHRDIKADNVLVDLNYNPRWVELELAQDGGVADRYFCRGGGLMPVCDAKDPLDKVVSRVRELHYRYLEYYTRAHTYATQAKDARGAQQYLEDMQSGRYLPLVITAKLADFGQSRILSEASMRGWTRGRREGQDKPRRCLTPRVVPLRYRAPELLSGYGQYDTGVDVWSLGCLLMELATGKSFLTTTESKLHGEVAWDAMIKVYQILGAPTEEEWAALDPINSKELYAKFPKFKPQLKNDRLLAERLGDNGFSLLCSMLAINPQRRITAWAILEHPFIAGSS